jgi:hypothetical protein
MALLIVSCGAVPFCDLAARPPHGHCADQKPAIFAVRAAESRLNFEGRAPFDTEAPHFLGMQVPVFVVKINQKIAPSGN